MTGRDWITEEEFEAAARFLQVVATMQYNKHAYYAELTDEEHRWNSHMRGEDYRRIENWLIDIIPNFRYWDAEQPGGATVGWDGKHLQVRDEGSVLATYDPAELRDPRADGFRGKLRGAGISVRKTERLRKLRGAGALGRVLYLISSRDNERRAEDIKDARKLVLGVLQEAGIQVYVISGDGALNEDHIVWGVYSEPRRAIDRQEALVNQRVTSLSVPAVRSWFRKPKPEPGTEPGTEAEPDPAHKRPLPPELREKLYTWITTGIATLLLLIGGVASWNESNPGIFIGVSCIAATVAAAGTAFADE